MPGHNRLRRAWRPRRRRCCQLTSRETRYTSNLRLIASVGLCVTDHAAFAVIVIDVEKILRVERHGCLRAVEVAEKPAPAFGQFDHRLLGAPVARFTQSRAAGMSNRRTGKPGRC